MFPVSAAMLKNPADYDASLEAFSRPLLRLIDYRLDGMGQMTVENETACWYHYMDMTARSEALYEFVIKAIGGYPCSRWRDRIIIEEQSMYEGCSAELAAVR